MKVTGFNINLTTDQMDMMNEFYGKTLGLTQEPNSGGYEVSNGAYLHLDTHSETSGRTKEPARLLVNFMVEDIKAEQAALEAKGVKFTRTEGIEYWGGKISTFSDPDGNLLQIMQYDPSADSTSAQS